MLWRHSSRDVTLRVYQLVHPKCYLSFLMTWISSGREYSGNTSGFTNE
jgi:hypothetical protein